MAMPPEEDLIAGQTAYEQARAYERIGWRIPYVYAAGLFLGVIFGWYLWSAYRWWAWTSWGVLLILWYFACRYHWEQLKKTYRANLYLLQQQREQYGNDLPWVQVEQQMAILAEIERENAERTLEE